MPQDFEQHLRSLREAGYTSILPADLRAHRRWGKRLPDRPLIITFDDGYLSTIETAEPLLKQYGFTAIVYLITGLIAESPGDRQFYERAPCMTWPEVKAAHARGTLAFGGHTRNHVNVALAERPEEEKRACRVDIMRHGRDGSFRLCR